MNPSQVVSRCSLSKKFLKARSVCSPLMSVDAPTRKSRSKRPAIDRGLSLLCSRGGEELIREGSCAGLEKLAQKASIEKFSKSKSVKSRLSLILAYYPAMMYSQPFYLCTGAWFLPLP